MLHSKFSLSFDDYANSVTIFIEVKVNNEKTFLSPSFNFNDEGKIIIADYVRYGYDKETFKYITRHIKSTIKEFKNYLEDSFKDFKINQEVF